jgi:hypothetical protein
MSNRDLTCEKDVVELMQSSKSEEEWNKNCRHVKTANNGQYPSFWWKAVILSNLAEKTANAWGGDAKIHISVSRH